VSVCVCVRQGRCERGIQQVVTIIVFSSSANVSILSAVKCLVLCHQRNQLSGIVQKSGNLMLARFLFQCLNAVGLMTGKVSEL